MVKFNVYLSLVDVGLNGRLKEGSYDSWLSLIRSIPKGEDIVLDYEGNIGKINVERSSMTVNKFPIFYKPKGKTEYQCVGDVVVE